MVISRWLLGFCFSKHDMELLDDPIPDTLYCKPCRTKQKALDLEGNESVDTLGSSAQGSSQDVVVTSEPLPLQNCSHDGHKEGSFNITHEVDKCDLWKHMVKDLAAPLPSPKRESDGRHFRGAYQFTDATEMKADESVWHPAGIDTSRSLFTLEECDTDLESQTQLPSYMSNSSPPYDAVVSSPIAHAQHGQWERTEPHEPVFSSSNNPLQPPPQSTAVETYQSTSV